MRVWNDKGSRQLFTELRRRRRMTPTCVTARQMCTLTGSIVLLGFQCRVLIRPTQEPGLVLSAQHTPSCSLGPLLSRSDPAPRCPHGVSIGGAHCQPPPEQARPAFLTPPSTSPLGLGFGWVSSTVPYRLPFARDCFCLRLGSKRKESALPTLDTRGQCFSTSWAPPVGLRTPSTRLWGWVSVLCPLRVV